MVISSTPCDGPRWVSRFIPDREAPSAKLRAIRWGDPYYMSHQLAGDLQGYSSGDGGRDFIFYVRPRKLDTSVTIVSRREPVPTSLPWTVVTKEYPRVFEAGSWFRFETWISPIVKHDKQEDDIVTDLRRKKRITPGDAMGINENHEAVLAWFSKRDFGFSVRPDHMAVMSRDHHVIQRPDPKPPVVFFSYDVKGILTVTDPHKFYRTLVEGVGKRRGFGCGLLRIARG